jgi:hypothetical protein
MDDGMDNIKQEEINVREANDVKLLEEKKRSFVILSGIGIAIIILLVLILNPSSSRNGISNSKIVPTNSQLQLQQVAVNENEYKQEISPIIDKFKAESGILSIDFLSKRSFSSEYEQAAKVYTNLVEEHSKIKSVPNSYADYDYALGKVLKAIKFATTYISDKKDVDPCTVDVIVLAENNFELMNLAKIEPISNSTHVDIANVPEGWLYTNFAIDPTTDNFSTKTTIAGLNLGLDQQIKKRYDPNSMTNDCK